MKRKLSDEIEKVDSLFFLAHYILIKIIKKENESYNKKDKNYNKRVQRVYSVHEGKISKLGNF
jgi:hypothetical protein